MSIKAENAELIEISEQFWALNSLPISFDKLLNKINQKQLGTWFGINFRNYKAWMPRHPVDDKPIYQVSSFRSDDYKDPSLNAQYGFWRAKDDK